jgi:hypothetical protein
MSEDRANRAMLPGRLGAAQSHAGRGIRRNVRGRKKGLKTAWILQMLNGKRVEASVIEREEKACSRCEGEKKSAHAARIFRQAQIDGGPQAAHQLCDGGT